MCAVLETLHASLETLLSKLLHFMGSKLFHQYVTNNDLVLIKTEPYTSIGIN